MCLLGITTCSLLLSAELGTSPLHRLWHIRVTSSQAPSEKDRESSRAMLIEAGCSLAVAFLSPQEQAGLASHPMALQFPLPQSPSPHGLSQAAGGQRHLVLLQDGCSSSQLDLSGKNALCNFSSSLPCCDSWFLSCPSFYGNFAFPHIFCTGKNNAKEALFIRSATSPVCSCTPVWWQVTLTMPHSAPHATMVPRMLHPTT